MHAWIADTRALAEATRSRSGHSRAVARCVAAVTVTSCCPECEALPVAVHTVSPAAFKTLQH
jgi:hypothetical protein